MPDSGTGTSFTTILLPVIVGGVIGVAGSFLGPWFLEGRKQEADKKKKRAEKFEELVSSLFEHNHWLDTMKNIRVYGYKDDHPLSPFAKVQAIASVYFPQFDEMLRSLEMVSDKYELWMMEAAQKRLAGKISELNAGFAEASTPYLEEFLSVVRKLKEYAKSEFQ